MVPELKTVMGLLPWIVNVLVMRLVLWQLLGLVLWLVMRLVLALAMELVLGLGM